ncbi:hypothetical protein [Endozoicomonas arenosclerae]|uniref:hypothetical protein n=1 Tax=Endozoicomonas arenosclerae TaxID=1633495 RepID=UPI0007861B0B|nr:hypothetical protein [Endozoicomonas arenosclerae]
MTSFSTPAQSFNSYIFFDRDTRGENGRKVYIDPGLVTRFVELVNPTTPSGKQSLEKMIGLKNSAAGVSSQSNQSNSSQHRLDCGPVIVTYSVLQSGTPNSHGEGVYITNIQESLNKGKGHLPGLYDVKSRSLSKGDWHPEKSNDQKISTYIGAIGAVLEPKDQAYSVEKTANAFGDLFLTNANGKRLGNSFSLYYTPSFVVDQLGTWRIPEQKIIKEGNGAVELAKVLIETEKHYWSDMGERQHHWYVFGHGAKLLSDALKQLRNSGQPLKHQSFEFIDPKANLGLLLENLERLQADVTNRVGRTEGTNLVTRLHQGVNDQLQNQVKALPFKWNNASTLTADTQTIKSLAQRLDKSLAGGTARQLPPFTGLIAKLSTVLGGW